MAVGELIGPSPLLKAEPVSEYISSLHFSSACTHLLSTAQGCFYFIYKILILFDDRSAFIVRLFGFEAAQDDFPQSISEKQ